MLFTLNVCVFLVLKWFKRKLFISLVFGSEKFESCKRFFLIYWTYILNKLEVWGLCAGYRIYIILVIVQLKLRTENVKKGFGFCSYKLCGSLRHLVKHLADIFKHCAMRIIIWFKDWVLIESVEIWKRRRIERPLYKFR